MSWDHFERWPLLQKLLSQDSDWQSLEEPGGGRPRGVNFYLYLSVVWMLPQNH